MEESFLKIWGRIFPTSGFGKRNKIRKGKLTQNNIKRAKQSQRVKKTKYKSWQSKAGNATKARLQPLINGLMIMCKDVFKEECKD